MPPRYAYWTILVDDQATAFRAGSQEDLMPTFKRLKEKHPSATMMWFQNGKLWPSRIDAQEAMIGRGEAGRRSDPRQAGTGFRNRERRPTRDRVERTAWTRRGEPSTPAPARNADDKLDWKPKGEFVPAPKRADRPDRPDWKSKTQDSRPRTSRSEKPEWKPKGSFDRDTKPAWKPKGSFDRDRTPDWKPKGSYGSKPKGFAAEDHESRRSSRPASGGGPRRTPESSKLEWKPKGEAPSGSRIPDPGSREKRKWVPKEEYKKSLGIEAKRDSKWRPGGEHRDPRQKYKDAKKAKWTKFKKTIRSKWETKKKKT